MKKAILIAALLVSAKGLLTAQENETPNYIKRMSMSKTEQTFNINEGLIGIRDFVTLKEGRLILELSGIEDYESFHNLDSLLEQFKKDIAFCRDSLDASPTANARIDYVLNPEYSFKKIRIKKYQQESPIFLNNNGSISRMKFEQDTIRLILQKSKPGIGKGKNGPCSVAYSVQATFIMGNYYDIDKVIADHVLAGIIDTLKKKTLTSRQLRHKDNPWYVQNHPVSITYNPYFAGPNALKRTDWLLRNEYDMSTKPAHSPRYMDISGNIGVGLIRNTLAPMGEFYLQFNSYLSGGAAQDRNIFRLSATPFFFFDRNAAGENIVNDNWFVNVSVGTIYGNFVSRGWVGREATIGFGYLLAEKGGYFKNTTFKIFTDLLYSSHLTLVPELIFTNNMKQIYPGLTLKIF